MKQLMIGNEAIARGAFEAGATVATAYPGTPSTEILENISKYKGVIKAEWAPNEKVALESVIGASIAGARALAAMKHVGLNVAADPFFTFAYMGVSGGAVVITADEPGQFSSQNEQDIRHIARLAYIPVLEPASPAEAYTFYLEAMKLSRKRKMPVILRMTTHVCHGKEKVSFAGWTPRPIGSVPAFDSSAGPSIPLTTRALDMKRRAIARLAEVAQETDGSPLHELREGNDPSKGVITADEGAKMKAAHEAVALVVEVDDFAPEALSPIYKKHTEQKQASPDRAAS